MSRNLIFNAIVLRTRLIGEANREVHLLTAEKGILRTILFGGPKSKLKAYTEPFNSGIIYLYHDPAKDSYKISDFDVQSWFPGLRESYERARHADAIAETILLSLGSGGNWQKVFELCQSIFTTLENANEDFCQRLLIYFLWIWADFLGVKPDYQTCAKCGTKFSPGNTAFFNKQKQTIFCQDCADEKSSIKLNPGTLMWLLKIENTSPFILEKYTMDKKTLYETKSFTQAIISIALGHVPGSWNF